MALFREQFGENFGKNLRENLRGLVRRGWDLSVFFQREDAKDPKKFF
jgi:hypothetical protein